MIKDEQMWAITPGIEIQSVKFALEYDVDGIEDLEFYIEEGWIHEDALEEVKVMLLKAKLKE